MRKPCRRARYYSDGLSVALLVGLVVGVLCGLAIGYSLAKTGGITFNPFQ
jgi:ABC-type Mn2+/Zn2+ transport system permease subunit